MNELNSCREVALRYRLFVLLHCSSGSGIKRTCGNILNSLLREWAVLPDQHLLRQIYNQVSKSSEGASIANGAL